MKRLLLAMLLMVPVGARADIPNSFPAANGGGAAQIPTVVMACPPASGTGPATPCPASGSAATGTVAPGTTPTATQSVQGGGPGALPVLTTDPNNAAFADMVPITPGTAFTAGRSFAFYATTGGTITITMLTGSRQVTIPILASASIQTLPFEITNLTLGTAVGTFWNLP